MSGNKPHFIMYSPWFTHFLSGWDHCHKASDTKTITAPEQFHEENEINQISLHPEGAEGEL